MSHLSPQETAVAKSQCIEVVTRLFDHYDRREYEAMHALMTGDALWNRPDGAARMGPELDAAMAKRSANLVVVHLLTNMTADVTAADRVTVRGIMLVVRDDQGALSPPPAKMSLPNSIIAVAAQCRAFENEWRVAQIDVNYLFKA